MSTPEFFQRGPSPLVRLVFFSAFSISLLVLDSRYHSTVAVRSVLSLIVYPAQQLALLPVQLARDGNEFFTSQHRLQADNDELRRKLMQLSERAQRTSSVEQELTELRGLSHLPIRPQAETMLAEVLHGGRNPYVAKLVLDRGSSAGLKPGQPVIDADGVVGQITSASPFSAEVTLVTEQSQQIPVRVLRNGLRTLAGGDGAIGSISLPFLPGGADIQIGDTLVTSGIDGVYPEGIPVATVSRIERNANRVFARIVCTPLAGIAHDRYVLAVTTPPAPPPQITLTGGGATGNQGNGAASGAAMAAGRAGGGAAGTGARAGSAGAGTAGTGARAAGSTAGSGMAGAARTRKSAPTVSPALTESPGPATGPALGASPALTVAPSLTLPSATGASSGTLGAAPGAAPAPPTSAPGTEVLPGERR